MAASPRALPARARLFLWSVLGAAACLIAAIAARSTGMALSWPEAAAAAPVMAAAAALVFLARIYPVVLTEKRPVKITFRLDGVVVFAAVLLLPAIQAVLIAAVGVGLHQIYVRIKKREYWYVCAFNTAQQVLAVGISAMTYQPFDYTSTPVLATSREVVPLLATTGVYLLVNTGLISTMLALIRSRRPWEIWIATHRWTWHLYLAHLLLGIFVADLYLTAPLAIPLVLLLAVVLRHAYASVAIIRDQTRQTIEMLADTVDRRDPCTFWHSQRVAQCARMIAQHLGLSEDVVDAVALAARVHDVGKIGISDFVLQKAGVLTAEEMDEMRQHTVMGADVVRHLPQYARGKEYILYHHERYDGAGTFGLRGTEIPLGARIIAVADAFDAMTSDRPYRRALDPSVAIRELERQRGQQFDPMIVDALTEALREQRWNDARRPEGPTAPALQVSVNSTATGG
ncbi:MAG: HD-GYP domain-containing protein [Armatimonadetes bacterium]|nr:HD-GYP domain-containing protein [Armatimonadota bacterium]